MVKLSKLKLMANLPIYNDNIPIYSPTLLSMADIDQEQYGKYVNYCIISKERLQSPIENEKEYDDYDILLEQLYSQTEFLIDFLEALFYFTKIKFGVASYRTDKDIVFVNNSGQIELNRKNYSSFIKGIKYVNCLHEEENVEEMDEFDRELARAEKVVTDAQNKNIEHPTLEDLISSVANMDGNGLSIINIWNLNIYQFYEQLKRGQMKEGFRLAIQQLLAGAKSEEVEVKSYLTNIE